MDASPPEDVLPEKRVIHRCKTSYIWGANVCLIALILLIFSDVRGFAPEALSRNSSFYWVLLCIFGIATLIGYTNVIRGLPKIVLDQKGLTLFNWPRTRAWAWREVGPFSIYLQHHGAARSIFGTPKTIWLVANSDADHDLLTAHDKNVPPSPVTAEINFPLEAFTVGRTQEAAEAFADELNRWREAYGAPEISLRSGDTPEAAARLATKHKTKKLIYAAALVIGIALLSLYLRSVLR